MPHTAESARQTSAPQPARENGNTLSLEVSLVSLPLPPAIGGQRAWSMLPNFAGKGLPHWTYFV